MTNELKEMNITPALTYNIEIAKKWVYFLTQFPDRKGS